VSRRAETGRRPSRPPRRPPASGRPGAKGTDPGHDEMSPVHGSVRVQSERLKEALESSRSSFVTLFDLSPIGYAVLDDQGRLEALNLTLATMLGQLRTYMVGLPFILSVAHEHRSRFLRYLHDLRETAGERRRCQVHLLGSAAVGTLPAFLVARRISPPGAPLRFLMAAIDQSVQEQTITGLEESGRQLRRLATELQARTEEAEQASARLRDMAREVNRAEQRERQRIARLLHDDLQQLLVSAKMRMGMLRQGTANGRGLEEITDLIDAAINSSRHLTSQISPPLLEDAGLEAGLRWLTRYMHEKHHLEVDLVLGLGAEPIELSDRDFLFQAAREMLFNVVKHGHVGSARMRAEVRRRRALLEVADQGSGFDPALIEKEDREGRGLRTLWERVRLLGGTFVVDSHPGNGCRVRLSLPLAETEKKKKKEIPRQPLAPDAAAAAASERVRVLIADDHRVVREGLQSFLSREEWLEVVGQAADGRQAVLMTRELQPDVVIMDISMPELNGIEATRIITGENPRVKIIGLSMHQQEDMAAAMIGAGADRYLTKGGPAEDLVQAVRELVPAAPGHAAPVQDDTRGPRG
jgi:signal transduction histidine kinase/ActR/RegA family two-component response regulator